MPSSSAALSGTHWSVLEALDNLNRKLGTVAEYAVPATRYQQLSRFAPLLMQVDVMGHLSLCRESLGETGNKFVCTRHLLRQLSQPTLLERRTVPATD
ncbi:hypothetical protein THAR02_01885 [Trichoderma harzianum]|uniref:Uncharacterized protein n=1 Tax=Trichoderma harzianum TaxID=5544 RepID=A0A0F9Y1L5_TRIHA|nr:hypothetical protein THAR02_01885 [Trichoderma harzianum]